MFRGKIKLVYKQEIDERSKGFFERAIFHTSYEEFLVKSRTFNSSGVFKTFSAIKENDKRAHLLNHQLSFSVLHFIHKLDNNIPGIKDNLGHALKFESPGFELIESHTEDISQHKVAVYYETGTLTLIEFMGEYLLLANGRKAENDFTETFVVKMQPNLSILNYQGIAHPQMAWIACQQ